MQFYLALPLKLSLSSDTIDYFQELCDYIRTYGRITNLFPDIRHNIKEIKEDIIREHPERRYEKATTGLRTANLVIAELSWPSIDVGYDIGMAHTLGIKCIFIMNQESNLPDRIDGYHKDSCIRYYEQKSIFPRLARIIQK